MQLSGKDIEAASGQFGTMSVAERIKWAADTFEGGLYAMTSAGVDSAVMLQQIADAGVSIPVVHINTGFLHPETLEFRDALRKRYGFTLFEYGPTKAQIEEIEYLRLWDGDMALYSKLTKLDPLSTAIAELGITALLVGVRADQTANRTSLDYLGRGHDGEFRMHPLLDWSKEQIEEYIVAHDLPRHPLYYQGYESVGDRQLTVPGVGRSGRVVMECGLHVAGGGVVTQNKQAT